MNQTATVIKPLVKQSIDWIASLKTNEHQTLKQIYSTYRSSCAALIRRKYQLTEDESKEIFQLSVIILYDNIMSSKLEELHYDLKNYILGIAHNKVYELYRRKKREQKLKNETLIRCYLLSESEDSSVSEELIAKLQNALQKIGDPCSHILQLFYYKDYSLSDITTLLDYKNVNTTKNLKYKCIKRLQKAIAFSSTHKS